MEGAYDNVNGDYSSMLKEPYLYSLIARETEIRSELCIFALEVEYRGESHVEQVVGFVDPVQGSIIVRCNL